MELIFKNPVSWRQELTISFRLAEMRNYLVGLKIPVPADTPPLEVLPRNKGWEVENPPGFPAYRGSLKVDSADREKITYVYTAHVVHRLFFPTSEPYNNKEQLALFYSEDAFASYLNWSFWNKRYRDNVSNWPVALWTVRERFGQEFTDGFVAQALISIKDNPKEGLDSHVDTYLCQKLKIGEGVRDSGFSNWPQVLDILADREGKWVYSACK